MKFNYCQLISANMGYYFIRSYEKWSNFDSPYMKSKCANLREKSAKLRQIAKWSEFKGFLCIIKDFLHRRSEP